MTLNAAHHGMIRYPCREEVAELSWCRHFRWQAWVPCVMLLWMMQVSGNVALPTANAGPKRGQFNAEVMANIAICREHFILRLRVTHFPPSEPGQFVQVLCDPDVAIGVSEAGPAAAYSEVCWEPGSVPPAFQNADLLGSAPYLRRPFSIAGRRDNPVSGYSEIDLIYRVIGKTTGRMAALVVGDSISILGPLGHGFSLPQEMTTALLVGGGVGIPPMIYLAEKLQRQGINALAFIGAQRADLIPLHITGAVGLEPALNVQEFAAFDTPTVIATDDGSLGQKGFVTRALQQFCQSKPQAGAVIFCCGPTPMMRATALVAAEFNLTCYASLEQPMACGMGTCQSCVIKYRPPGAEDWVYKLTCKDGPVFNTMDILWQ